MQDAVSGRSCRVKQIPRTYTSDRAASEGKTTLVHENSRHPPTALSSTVCSPASGCQAELSATHSCPLHQLQRKPDAADTATRDIRLQCWPTASMNPQQTAFPPGQRPPGALEFSIYAD